jgi:hypothetical protein
VLEHLPDPQGELEKIHELLSDRGQLVIEVPNFGSWYARLFQGHWFHLDPPRHLYHFSPNTLLELLEKTGFHTLDLSTTQLKYDAFGAVQSLLNVVFRRRNLLNDFLTQETTWKELRIRDQVSLLLSLASLGILFPTMLSLSFLLRPFIAGGTLRARFSRRVTWIQRRFA